MYYLGQHNGEGGRAAAFQQANVLVRHVDEEEG